MSSKSRSRIKLAASAYAVLYVGVCLVALLIERLPQSTVDNVPLSVAGLVASILGPPVVFTWAGVTAWSFVLVSLLLVAACLVISRFCWRRYPDSELFGLPLLAAGVVWIGSVWLAVAVWGI